MTIAELSIKRPVTAIMFFVSLFVIGLIAAIRLPLEAFPEVSPPFIFVQLPYTGSTPEEVERTLLRPVEEALSTMTGIKRMRFRLLDGTLAMPLLLAFVLVATFIWVAENVATWSSVWLYPNQLREWTPVSPAKLGSWFLLMIISVVLVTLVHPPRRSDAASEAAA